MPEDEMLRRAVEAFTNPAHLWSRPELLARPSPIPPVAGVYGWYFRTMPGVFDVAGCVTHDEATLLYLGISPRRATAESTQTLRNRLRTHCRGNASRSTLRLTLGILLGFELQPTPGGRLTFGAEGEARLSAWMDENAFVTWFEAPEPRLVEEHLIQQLDLPLNLEGNRHHAFWPELTALR